MDGRAWLSRVFSGLSRAGFSANEMYRPITNIEIRAQDQYDQTL